MAETTKITVVLNCDPLNCFLFDTNLKCRLSFTSPCIFLIWSSRNPSYSIWMETLHKIAQMHKTANSTKFISTCQSTQENPTSCWEKMLYSFGNASWLYHVLPAASPCSYSGGKLWGRRTTEQPQLDETCGVIVPNLCPKQDQLQQVSQEPAWLSSKYLPGQNCTTALATHSSAWPPFQQLFFSFFPATLPTAAT